MASKRTGSPFEKAVEVGKTFKAAQLLRKRPVDTTRNQAARVQQLLTPEAVKRIRKSPLKKFN